ncbi:MAG TPA: hypothetical protein VGU68_16790 [Ktedonobacteraceae bacterium]|nr:hypothetical protein [Ktedonobacteraceae bacterium]HEV2662267.1 hypothetical protein [Ktedonobacteraceae bacterium]
MSQQTAPPKPLPSAAAKLFDLRILIGGLFTLYGVVLIIAGLVDGPAEIQKAAGIRINLWMGIGMLVLGLLFLLWWRVLPVIRPADAPSEVEPDAHHTIGTVPSKDMNAREEEREG